MIECNVDIAFSRENPRAVKLQFPHGWEDAVRMLEHALREKGVAQAYVKLDKPHRPRTTGEGSQSHHFNGHVQQIAEHTGNSFDDEKMHLKREAISMGYPFHTTSYGEVVPESGKALLSSGPGASPFRVIRSSAGGQSGTGRIGTRRER